MVTTYRSLFTSVLFTSLLALALAACGTNGSTADNHDPQESVSDETSGNAGGTGSVVYASNDHDSLTIPLETENGKPARFAFRSGRIEMRYTGDYDGVRRLLFTEYGLYERKIDSAVPSERISAVVPPLQLSILRPDYYGIVDLRTGKGQRASNSAYQTYASAVRTDSVPYGELALQKSGGIRLEDTTLLGKYRCRVYRQSGDRFTHTIWVWGGVPIQEQLEMKGDVDGSYLLVPTDVEIGVSVPDSMFVFPEGYTITDVSPAR